MNWPAALMAAAVVAGYVCLGVINRPVEVYVWARDVSVCASVAVEPVVQQESQTDPATKTDQEDH